MREQFRKNENVLLQLRHREYCTGYQARNNLKILRKLVCDEGYTYEKVWQKFSNKAIFFERGHAYFDNYVKCYGGYGIGAVPRHLYSLSVPNGRKIKEALAGVFPVESISQPFKHCRGSLYCIAGKAWLVQYNWLTGELINEVYISNRVKFSDIAWNEVNSRVVLKSINYPLSEQQSRVSTGMVVVKVLAFFDLAPLRFKAMLEITKNVFGKDVTDASSSQGTLCTFHYSGTVKFYSLDYIFQEYDDPDWAGPTDVSGYPVGRFPDGLPYNIKITDLPPVLFQVRCDQHLITIGGFPWHYMSSPCGHEGTFHIRSIETDELAENGKLHHAQVTCDPDRASFLNDDRILFISPIDVRLYALKEDNKRSRVEMSFKIDMRRQERNKANDQPRFTSSGRLIQQRVSEEEVTEYPDFTIYNVEYEDELDLLWTSSVYYSSQMPLNRGMVRFHDNHTGKLLKEVVLDEPFEETCEHRVEVDLDTIIQLAKSSSGKFVCIFYRLTANTGTLEKEEIEKETNSGESCNSKKRSSRCRRGRRSSIRYTEDDSDEDFELEPQSRRTKQTRRTSRNR